MPPIVRIAIAYGAGLTAGLVFLPPWGVGLMLGGAAVALAMLESDAAVLLLALAVGLVAGREAGDRQRHECAVAWRPGTHAAWVTMEEPLSEGGRADLQVVWSADQCHGELAARFPPAVPGYPTAEPGNTLVVIGVLDDVGRFQVRHWHRLPGHAPWLPALRAALT